MVSLSEARVVQRRDRVVVRCVLTGVLLATALVACDQNMSDEPLPEASPADVARLADRLTAAPSLSTPAGTTLSGTIEIASRLAPLTSASDVIFVMAREPGSGGPPLSVQRLEGNSYPMRFVLETTTGMLAAAAEGRPLQIIVKVDRDGDAGTSAPEDLLGVAEADVRPGESGIVVPLAATLGEVAAAVGEEMPGNAIAGTITLPAELNPRTTPADVVFVIARDPRNPGPPVAVARLSGNRYPMRFRLDDSNRMLGGTWPAAVELEVRVDKDGDPMTRGPLDLAGRAPAPVRPGDADVRVELGEG